MFKINMKIKTYITSFIAWLRSKICSGIKSSWEWIRDRDNANATLVLITSVMAFGTFWMARSTKHMAQTNKVLVESTIEMVQDNKELIALTQKSNERAEKLFIGQEKPLIDVSPVSIISVRGTEGTFSSIIFSVTNYSGFDAYDIAVDTKYGEGNDRWISEWIKADNDKRKKEEEKSEWVKALKTKEKKGVVIGYNYLLSPKVLIKKLKHGETTDKDFEGKPILICGQFNLETEFNEPNKLIDGLPVFVRVTWKSKEKYGHVFDEVHKYRLICTKTPRPDPKPNDPNSSIGWAFTLIPEGIISQKDSSK